MSLYKRACHHSVQQDIRIFISFCFPFQTFLEKGGGLNRENHLPALPSFWLGHCLKSRNQKTKGLNVLLSGVMTGALTCCKFFATKRFGASAHHWHIALKCL
jgi:hypothetical protein